MYCKKCGKDIGEAKFCQYCGNSNDCTVGENVNSPNNDFLTTIKNKIKEIGHEKLIKLIAFFSVVISVIIRIIHNEIETVYDILVQEDYFVVSDIGRKYMLFMVVVQCVLSAFLYTNAKKEQTIVSKKTVFLFAVSLAVQILAMVLRFPAPY